MLVCIKAPLYPKSVLYSAVEVDNRRLMEGYKCNLGTSQHWKDTNGTHNFTHFREIKKIFQKKKNVLASTILNIGVTIPAAKKKTKSIFREPCCKPGAVPEFQKAGEAGTHVPKK